MAGWATGMMPETQGPAALGFPGDDENGPLPRCLGAVGAAAVNNYTYEPEHQAEDALRADGQAEARNQNEGPPWNGDLPTRSNDHQATDSSTCCQNIPKDQRGLSPLQTRAATTTGIRLSSCRCHEYSNPIPPLP